MTELPDPQGKPQWLTELGALLDCGERKHEAFEAWQKRWLNCLSCDVAIPRNELELAIGEKDKILQYQGTRLKLALAQEVAKNCIKVWTDEAPLGYVVTAQLVLVRPTPRVEDPEMQEAIKADKCL